MGKAEEKFARRRLRSSYITTTISITLVLFMLGMIGSFVLFANELSKYIKENYAFEIFIEYDTHEADVIRLQKYLESKDAVKNTRFVTAEEASKEYEEQIGESFIEAVGRYPIPNKIEIRVNAAYANLDSLNKLEQRILQEEIVTEVAYPKAMINVINQNMRTIGLVLLGFSVLLFIIAFALINNTIRLSVYANRFIIRSMQLVGATQRFIRKPFIIRGIIQGLIGAALSIGLLVTSFYFFMQYMEIQDIGKREYLDLLLILFGFVILLGILISWISTYFAVRKYLKIKTDSLYN